VLPQKPATDIFGQMPQIGRLDYRNLKLTCEHKWRKGRGGGELLVLAHLECSFFAPRFEAAPEHLVHLGCVLLRCKDQFR
jgi:hypothetical protein